MGKRGAFIGGFLEILGAILKIRYVLVSCGCNLAMDDEMSNICEENELGFHEYVMMIVVFDGIMLDIGLLMLILMF